MNKDEMARVADLLRQFEREGPENPQQGEKLIAEVFRVCGQEVVESGFAETGARNIDCFFRTTLAGKPQTIGVEIKAGNVAADDATVDYAYSMLETGRFDRFMVVSRLGYTQAAIARADKYGWGEVDLLDPQGLHNWIFRRREEPKEEADAYDLIITNTMRQLALAIADKPEVLWRVEWRELEKVLRQAFDGIGYETTLTRPAKDGGFDLELTAWDGGMRHTYVVEVKHWKEKRPGSGELRKLISVTASKKATGGLLLSSSGFTDNIHTGMAEYTEPRPIRLGDGEKIVSLCRLFKRTNSPYWIPISSPGTTLFDGTKDPTATYGTSEVTGAGAPSRIGALAEDNSSSR